MNRWSSFIDEIAQLFAGNSHMGIWIKAAIAVLLGLMGWLVVKAFLYAARKKLASSQLIQSNKQLLKMIRNALAYTIMLFVGMYLVHIFQLQMLQKLLPALFVVLLARPMSIFLLVCLKYLEQSWADKTETKVDNIIFDLLNRFSGVIIYAVAVVLSLDILGINVMPFIAGAGVLGVAVGFAAKDTLSNLIAGILLIIDRPFEVGDRIEVWSAPVNSATWGDVIDIGLRATKIKTTDNIIIVIPNNEIMKRDIVNYTLISSQIRVRINIGIAYDSDIEKAKAAILKVAEDTPWVAATPEPVVVVRNFGESSVDLQLRVWIDNARMRMNTISYITDRIKTVFDQEHIEIPYPKRDITIINKSA